MISVESRGFTLIEVLVVVALISLLAAILIPALTRARAQSNEVVCRCNLRQIDTPVKVYASSHRGWYPLADYEINPHLKLIKATRADRGGLLDAMYCPQASMMEQVAQNTSDFPPVGRSTSVIDTAENRRLGNISYFYWSMRDRSAWRSTNHAKYPDPQDDRFRPRHLRLDGNPVPLPVTTDPLTPVELQGDTPADFWVLSDFFRKKAPFPHTRRHKSGLHVQYLDGHADWMFGQPRRNFQ
jgi:prepilin-type N-terminal cleavage/methylation domain-containing protein/prepilin-type processing-associated H-X9-DG protein